MDVADDVDAVGGVRGGRLDRRRRAIRADQRRLHGRGPVGVRPDAGERDVRPARASRRRRRTRPRPRRPSRSRTPAARGRHRPSPASSRGPGRRTSVISSSGASPVENGPVKNPSTGIVRSPLTERATISASSASRQAARSDAGIGVGDRAADRAPVADLDVADRRQRVAEQAVVPGRRLGELAVRGHGADRQPTVRQPADALELAQPADVDQPVGRPEPELEERQQALAAGQHLDRAVRPGDGLSASSSEAERW